jgi:hypothetical protein
LSLALFLMLLFGVPIMKRLSLTALLLTIATLGLSTTAFGSAAQAAEMAPGENIQATRLAFLNHRGKAIDNIQKTRLDFLSDRGKAVENIQREHLDVLNTKAIETETLTR